MKKIATKKKKTQKQKPQKKSNDLIVVKKAIHPEIPSNVLTEEKIIAAFDAMGITKKLDEQQKKLFIAVAREFQLNPLRREIHAVKMGGDDEDGGGTLVPVVGYEVYIDRAEATGRLEYWFIEETGEIDPDWKKSTYRVTLIIKRRDWPKEFRWTVRYVEAVGLRYNKTKGIREPNSMWLKRGHFMTQKCVIGQGFRLIFREILRGMPYIDAEVENAENGDSHEEEHGPLREPQSIKTESTPIEPTIQIVEGQPSQPVLNAYSEIMSDLSMTVKSKEGPMVALFSNPEKKDWKAKADTARERPEELKGILQELDDLVAEREQIIKGRL